MRPDALPLWGNGRYLRREEQETVMFGIKEAAVKAVEKELPAIVADAVSGTIDRVLPGVIHNVLRKMALENKPLEPGQTLSKMGFVYEVAFEFIRNGMDVHEAILEAADVVLEFVQDEGVYIGHPKYDWGKSGARDIAREAMRYWEN